MGAALTTPPVAYVQTAQPLVVKVHWERTPDASVIAVVLNGLIPRAPPVFS